MAAMIKMAEWFDRLREEGVYDNTRIIICSDHGYPLNQFDDMIFFKDWEEPLDIEGINPLLLVKDFNAKGFETSDEFMTLADIPSMAMTEVINDPVNPFTGKAINNDEKYAHVQEVIYSTNSSIDDNNGNAFKKDSKGWFSVHDDIYNAENWEYIGQK